MRNLIVFFTRHYFFFLFLFLEIVCILLITNHSQYQRSTILHTTNNITGWMNESYTGITDYLGLRKENERLASENAILRSRLPENLIIYCTGNTSVPVSDSCFSFIPARVISNSVNKRNNYFMLNKGSSDGIKEDMGVMTGDGVTGIIIEVTTNYSTAMSLLHKETRISGKIKKNGQLVNIRWGGGNFRLGKIENIPTHISLDDGDTIITSGHSHLFPEGVLIGITESFDFRQDQLFNSGVLEFSVDFNSLHYVYVICNNSKEEILIHKEVTENE